MKTAIFHHFPPLTFIIHYSQHKIAIYRLRKVASKVEVTKNASDENAYELIIEVMKCV